MKKFSILVISFIFFLGIVVAVHAQNDQDQNAIPEKEGDYRDPDHPALRVRVFIHKSKKPASVQSALVSLTCQPDSSSSAIVPPAGWHLPSNWTYTLNPSSVPSSVGGENLVTIAKNAFDQWVNAISGKVAITRTSFNTSVNRARFDGQNIIAWGRTSGTALAVTYTWYYSSNGLAAEEDVIFNKQFPWYWNASNTVCTDSNSYDAQNILTHELGHWMGLNDTYDAAYTENTMFGYGAKGETKKDTLTNGDITGVKAIYP